jgi:hypothetical protein
MAYRAACQITVSQQVAPAVTVAFETPSQHSASSSGSALFVIDAAGMKVSDMIHDQHAAINLPMAIIVPAHHMKARNRF